MKHLLNSCVKLSLKAVSFKSASFTWLLYAKFNAALKFSIFASACLIAYVICYVVYFNFLRCEFFAHITFHLLFVVVFVIYRTKTSFGTVTEISGYINFIRHCTFSLPVLPLLCICLLLQSIECVCVSIFFCFCYCVKGSVFSSYCIGYIMYSFSFHSQIICFVPVYLLVGSF